MQRSCYELGLVMDMYKAQSAEIVIDGDVLILTRKKIGKDDVRRIPLAAVTDVRLKPGGKLAPALLQLVLNGEPPADMALIEANTLVFPSAPKYKAALEELHARLLAVTEHNSAAGGGPVAYDAPRKGLLDRVAAKAEASVERSERKQADRVNASLAQAGITRPDVVAAAHATSGIFGMAAEIPRLASMLRLDEPLLRATHATVEGQIRLVAITVSRLLILDEAGRSHEVDELPLTAIVATSMEKEFLENELTLRLLSGQKLELDQVRDITAFAATLREAVHRANTPTPTPPAVAAAPAMATAPAAQQDVLAQIAKLGELHTAGILTDEEFQTKKTDLLRRL